MKRKFFKALLTLLVLCTCVPLTGNRAEAEENITITVYAPGSSTPIKFNIKKGDSLYTMSLS